MGYLLGPDFVAAVRSYTWRATPCRILESSLAEEAYSRSVTHVVLRVAFEYSAGGQRYRSRRFTTGSRQGTTDRVPMEQAATQYPPGAAATCFVNPRDPSEAVLRRGELWGGIFLLAPLLLLGLIEHEFLIGWWESRRQGAVASGHIPLSETNDALRPDLRLQVFGGLSLFWGLAFGTFCVGIPLGRWMAVRTWEPVTCLIVRNDVTQRTGVHGPDYDHHLLYEYAWLERVHRSDTWQLHPGIGRPVVDLLTWAGNHPAGTRTQAYINPARPWEAVLDRRFVPDWIPGALGLAGITGGWLLLSRARAGRRERAGLSGESLESVTMGGACAGSRILRTGSGRLVRALLLVVAALPAMAAGIWSLGKSFEALRSGNGDVMNTLYGGGALVLAAWLLQRSYRLLRRQAAPDLMLEVTPGSPRVGGPVQIRWSLSGRT
ncbi:MAG: DUF3592 domain-containing protein, partial [Verrucomicrobia bacterium]|nr:DUF3592 domain-containing protein [Verrucomicrobiota bacterium]